MRKNVSLQQALAKLRPQLAAAAQAVVDEWEQDEDGVDEEWGMGGACDRVADAMADIIAKELPEVDVRGGGQDGDDHAFLLVTRHREQYNVDIPANVYEIGGGYRWRKIPGAFITPEDVLIEAV
jgi:hypothetical protein